MTEVIRIEKLSKRYDLGLIGSGTLREDFNRWMGKLWRTSAALNNNNGMIWALRGINLQIEEGEVVGIIGVNGAGKSTLLKILCRITAPTEGSVRIRGKVASLLEVGTGFHPELTGRENIFLSGAILGMKKTEIHEKFDEILDFSGVEKFIDTPVKRYSSGMYVRLAFAVAAYLEPEILIIDEVLAVGDVEFQKKCLGKMSSIAGQGRTVLFVSHSMQAIRRLCRRGIVLKEGRIVHDAPVNEAVEYYLLGIPTAATADKLDDIIGNLPPDPSFRMQKIVLTQKGIPIVDQVLNGLSLEITFTYDVLEPTRGLRVFFDLCDTEGTLLIRSFHDEQNEGIVQTEPGRYVTKATIPANFLAAISYDLYFQAGIFNVRYCIPNGIRLRISVQQTGEKNRSYLADGSWGKIAPIFSWSTESRS